MAQQSGLMAWVRFQLPGGGSARATHGDIVGRLAASAVQVDDPGVSEAHALVSLRAGAFRLLSLRGQIAVGGEVVREALLAPGSEVQLTPRLVLEVTRVQLPHAVLAIEGPGITRQALPASCAITTVPRVSLSPSYSENAAAWVWSNGIEWSLRIGRAGVVLPLRAGETFEVGGVRLTTSLMPLEVAGAAVTLGPALDLEPLVIETRFDVVHFMREGLVPVTIAGRPARIICELVALGGIASWEVLAREIWPDDDRLALRKKLDMTLARLRDKLRAARIRPHLVRPRGNGTLELVLHERDRVVEAPT